MKLQEAYVTLCEQLKAFPLVIDIQEKHKILTCKIGLVYIKETSLELFTNHIRSSVNNTAEMVSVRKAAVTILLSLTVILSLGPEFTQAQCCFDLGNAAAAVLALGAVGSLIKQGHHKHGHHGHHGHHEHHGHHGLLGHHHGHYSSGYYGHPDDYQGVQLDIEDEPQYYGNVKKLPY